MTWGGRRAHSVPQRPHSVEGVCDGPAYLDALNKFRKSEGWEAGVDAEVAFVQVGATASVATLISQNPIAGFVFDQKGLMAGVSLKGAKFTPIRPE